MLAATPLADAHVIAPLSVPQLTPSPGFVQRLRRQNKALLFQLLPAGLSLLHSRLMTRITPGADTTSDSQTLVAA
jgi:hypothetical protein